jgi:hypothetical protein
MSRAHVNFVSDLFCDREIAFVLGVFREEGIGAISAGSR